MSTIITYVIAAIVLVFVLTMVLILLAKTNSIQKLKKHLQQLEREKNLIVSTPVNSELSKVEVLLKNEKISEKYQEWQERYDSIKNKRHAIITDMLLEVDGFIEARDVKNAKESINKLEMEIYKVRTATDNLLEEIREITMSEERNRSIITKLKSKYRELEKIFIKNKTQYRDIYKYIELQFENIEKKFQDFELAMEQNEYQEIVSIVKVLDEMIAHIGVIVEEVPDIVLMLENIIPSRIREIEEVYQKMIDRKYPLSYLKVEYNLDEINKKTNEISDRLKILNIENSMFELKTFL